MTDSHNPVRTLASVGLEINEDGTRCQDRGNDHKMISIKLSPDSAVKFVERCTNCGWIDEASLQWWVEDAIKLSTSKRAQRIAIAASQTPFAFVQTAGYEELTLEEILFQALGAASMCWVGGTGDLQFDSSRAKEIGLALMREVDRAMHMAQHAGRQGADQVSSA